MSDDLLARADAWLSAFHNKGGVSVPGDSYLAVIRDLADRVRELEEAYEAKGRETQYVAAERDRARQELAMARMTIEDGLRTAMLRSLTEWNEYVRRANSAIIHIDAHLKGKQ